MSDIYNTSVTVADFIEDVRRAVTDPNKVEFSDEEIISYLNDALIAIFQGLIIRRIPVLVKTTTVDSFPYTLPEKFGGIYAVVDTDGNEAILISPTEKDSVSDFSFYVLGNQLYVAPDEREITLYYYELPYITSTSDTIPYYYIIGSGLKWFVLKMLFQKMEMRTPDEEKLMAFFGQLAERIATLLPQKPKHTRVKSGV